MGRFSGAVQWGSSVGQFSEAVQWGGTVDQYVGVAQRGQCIGLKHVWLEDAGV